MKLQSIEASVRHALLRDGLSPEAAHRAASVASRELHVARKRLIAIGIAAGLSKRCIGRHLGLSHVHVMRLATESGVVHRPGTDVPATAVTIDPHDDRTPGP